MTNEQKTDEICKRHIFDSNHFDCCMEIAQWKDEQFAKEKQQWIDKACECLNKQSAGFWIEHLVTEFKKSMKGE